jgi:hypothetical protein
MEFEPIPYFYESLNRSAIGVIAKQPLIDWHNSVYPDSPMDKIEGTMYLISSKEETSEMERWLKKNFKDIFENELNEWCTDEATWPAKRTYALFSDWFEVRMYPITFDMEDSKLTKR